MSEKNGNGNGNGNGDKLDRLLEKRKETEAQIAEEKLRRARREKKDAEKLEGIVGRAILRELQALKDGTGGNEKEAEALETILRGILASESVAPMYSPGDKKLLRAKDLLR